MCLIIQNNNQQRSYLSPVYPTSVTQQLRLQVTPCTQQHNTQTIYHSNPSGNIRLDQHELLCLASLVYSDLVLVQTTKKYSRKTLTKRVWQFKKLGWDISTPEFYTVTSIQNNTVQKFGIRLFFKNKFHSAKIH